MKTTRLLPVHFAVICGVALFTPPAVRAQEFAAIASRVSDDYARVKLANGSYQPETYAFGKGGYWGGGPGDRSIDGVSFESIARVIAGPLKAQAYVPSRDAKATKLLIMVYWGTTNPPERATDSASYQTAQIAMQQLNARGSALGENYISKPGAAYKDATGVAQAIDSEMTAAMALVALENYKRDQTNRRNAQMLGYDSWWEATAHLEGSPLQSRRQDMIEELEENRYFVVLMAYDFQLMWKEKKPKLLWETRYSIRERRNEFEKQLAAMTLQASRYFGQDSHGLLHKPVPEGKVELGELKSLGEEPEKSK